MSTEFTFNRTQVARIFFGRGIAWLRRNLSKQLTLPDGSAYQQEMQDARNNRPCVYTLDDIQELTVALHHSRCISPDDAAKVYMVLRLLREIWER